MDHKLAVTADGPSIHGLTEIRTADSGAFVESKFTSAGRHSPFDRLIDCLLAIAIAVVLLPVIVFAVIALSVSGGPVLFKQARVGRHGRRFMVFKFRSMVPNAEQALHDLLANDPAAREEWEREFKLKNDPRVTPVGRFLRKTSLDELPQLLNVIVGDMSLVGPRPVAPGEVARYGRYIEHYLAQRPGLTGLWQVSGRNDCSYQRRIALDAYYARNRTVFLDIVILAKTIQVVVTGRGAY